MWFSEILKLPENPEILEMSGTVVFRKSWNVQAPEIPEMSPERPGNSGNWGFQSPSCVGGTRGKFSQLVVSA
jgi:hypothetical protein